jgi:hypothetical protein
LYEDNPAQENSSRKIATTSNEKTAYPKMAKHWVSGLEISGLMQFS